MNTAPAASAFPAAPPVDDRFQKAAGHFARFFKELSDAFLEREQLLAQFSLALLSREHLLMTGPPGTAKSQLAASVLGRIIDESTGKPSLFARQFTENTVQTDLIGPIDFKTLVEKGRTEHFTDEGMLGEVHAFLDEVFDGRDMMLRSTLNLLLERELKQGGRTTKGRIECAFMTSNRYIAEVLESSRDVLLAFLDRIAFVNFVPRGFAEEGMLGAVVRRQAGGRGRGRLVSPLSVQDLDVLQSAVDSVYVSDGVCNALVALIESLDAEFAIAARADPHFIPTRYFSTRTAVRAVHVLRSIAVYDKIFNHPQRTLEVQASDLGLLYLHLLLGGLPPEKIAKRLTRETDPRERRQLEIARTEREIFDRCFRKLPPVTDAAEVRQTLNLVDLERMAVESIANPDPKELVYAARELATAASSGRDGADRASELLERVIGNLLERAVRAGISPADTGHLLSLVEQLSTLADGLETAFPGGRPTARWLRGRALAMIDDAGTIAPEGTLQTISTIAGDRGNTDAISIQAEARLQAAEALAAVRRDLEASGADVADAAESAEAWKRAVSRLEDELAILWDALLMTNAAEALASPEGGRTLSKMLAALRPAISHFDALALRLEKLKGEPTTLKARVFAPRMKPLVSAAFERMKVSGRHAVVEEVRAIRDEIERSGLGSVIDPAAALGWAAAALVRNDKGPSKVAQGARTHAGFEALRASEDQLSSLDALIDIAIALQPGASRKPDAPLETLGDVMGMLRAIPRETANRIATSDLDRISAEVGYLEEWWNGLGATVAATKKGAAPKITVFEEVVQSGFLRVLRSETVLLSLPRAARDLAEAFPEQGAAAADLERRIRALDASCTGALITVLQGKVDASWTELFKKSGSST